MRRRCGSSSASSPTSSTATGTTTERAAERAARPTQRAMPCLPWRSASGGPTRRQRRWRSTSCCATRSRTTGRRPRGVRRPRPARSRRPTSLSLRGLKKFGTPEQNERITERRTKARKWLLATSAKDTEDRVFRLSALKLTGADEKEVRAAMRELVQTQRKDGGWAQLEKGESDAYATGSALVALHQAGGMPDSDAVYRRGLKFLIGSQREDGSWLVRSRSKPFQNYFETGFPHGKDQFISSAASGWAATALALACDPAPKKISAVKEPPATRAEKK